LVVSVLICTVGSPVFSPGEEEISMSPNTNWIELNDARTSDKLWVNIAMVTAIEASAGNTRIRFDKDNYITVTHKPQQVFALAGIGVVK